jgi:hypothetical protein
LIETGAQNTRKKREKKVEIGWTDNQCPLVGLGTITSVNLSTATLSFKI